MLRVAAAIYLVRLVASHPLGVPLSVCVSMAPEGPGHGNAKPQASPVPFQFLFNTTATRNKEPVEFTIQSEGSRTFEGFMVQARDHSSATPDKAVGAFRPKGDNPAKTIRCYADNVNIVILFLFVVEGVRLLMRK